MGKYYGRRAENKTKSAWKHFSRRASERLGFAITKATHQDIIDQIQNDKGYLVEKQSNARSIWEVKIADQKCEVIYDKLKKRLITVLPIKDNNEFTI